jgi:hypothetical protein
MKQWARNYILFIIMFLLGIFQAVSGFVLWLVIPHGQGYRGGRGLDLVFDSFVWSRDTWMDLHDWTAVALLVMLIIHLVLHWKWIIYMTKKSVGINN